jgi:hypothetical protein
MEENSDTDLFVEFSRNMPSFSLYPLKLLTRLTIMEKVLEIVRINLHSLCISTYRYVRGFNVTVLRYDGTTLELHTNTLQQPKLQLHTSASAESL